MAKTRIPYLKVDRLDVQNTLVAGTTLVDLANAATDEKAKVSATDTTPGFLQGKLVAGTNITLTKGSAGANETLTIAASGGGKPDKYQYTAEYTNASSSTFTTICEVTGLQPNTYYLISLGGYFDPQYSSPNAGWQDWRFRVVNGSEAIGTFGYPSIWTGYSTASTGTQLPNSGGLVHTMMPIHYSMVYDIGFGKTWNADYGGHIVGIHFSIYTGSNANNTTLKWQGRKNAGEGTGNTIVVGGSLTGYYLMLTAKPINI